MKKQVCTLKKCPQIPTMNVDFWQTNYFKLGNISLEIFGFTLLFCICATDSETNGVGS